MRPNLFVPVDDGGLGDRPDAVDLVARDEAKVVNPHLHAVRPNLSVVVDHNGEVVSEEAHGPPETLEELRVLYRKQQGTIKGWMLRCDALEKELERKQDKAPEAPRVLAVLDRWGERAMELGWWLRRPFYKPGHIRWKTVSARLKEVRPDGSHPYDEDYCFWVIEGALNQPKARTERAWVDAKSIFLEGNLEAHYARGRDPDGERIRTTAVLPREWRHVDTQELSRRCECGHLRVFHSRSDPERYGWQPCLEDGCACMDFDDLLVD